MVDLYQTLMFQRQKKPWPQCEIMYLKLLWSCQNCMTGELAQLMQDSRSSYSFGNIYDVGDPKLSEEKI